MQSCASAPGSRSMLFPIRRTISRSRRRMTSASPRRWRVSCGEPDSVPHGRRGGGGPRAHHSPPALGRIDCLPDRNGVRRGLPAARRGRGGAAAPEGAAAGQTAPAAGEPPRHGRGAGAGVHPCGERAGPGVLARAAVARASRRERPTSRPAAPALPRGCLGGREVASAAAWAWDGSAVSEGAYLVGLERGVDLSAHRARLLTRELVDQADLILTMARHHRARVDELGGEARVFVLGEYAGREGDAAEVSDPFGGDLEVYRDTCVELEALIDTAVERIVKEFASGGNQR